jgi:hypothetical protein
VVWRFGCVLVVAAGCYQPTLPERLACADGGRCPGTQACDPVYGECASFALCAPPEVIDTFDGAEPCAPWGHTFGSAVVELRDGALALTPSPVSNGGCTVDAAIPFTPQGVFVEVAAVVDDGFTTFAIESGQAAVQVGGGQLILTSSVFGESARVPYDADAMRWWRMRPTEADGVLGEYSPDGVRWTRLGGVPIEPFLEVVFEVTVDTTVDAPGTAEFASLDLCPPGAQAP